MLVHDVTIKPEFLDEMRECRRHAELAGKWLEHWERKFATAEILQRWEVRDLDDILCLWIGRLPIVEMTGASEVTAFHNPGKKAEASGGSGYRIEHVALALLRLYVAGVRLPEALSLAMALRSRIAKKKILTQDELRIFWADREIKAWLSCTAFRWPAGVHAEAFGRPDEAEAGSPPRRLNDGRFCVRSTDPGGAGFEVVFKDWNKKLRTEVLNLGIYSAAFAPLERRCHAVRKAA